MQWNGFDPRQNKALPAGHDPRPEIEVADGDVLITRAGPVNRVGIACCVKSPPQHLMLSDKIVRVHPNESLLPESLVAALASSSAQQYFRQGKTGLAESQVNISREKLLKLRITVPSLEEQRQIVGQINVIQSKLSSLEGLREGTKSILDAMPASILDRAFRGNL